ncbi:MAG: methyltransferase domain-containing protein [Candidatus Dependentiae bacterium]
MKDEQLKSQVKAYWNKASCGTEYILKEKYTLAYFQEIEQHRYTIEPEIFSFAQFPRWHGKEMLEVGIGAGTDFTQWVRSGAVAHGIDLTQEAIYNTQKRLSLFGLSAKEVKVADAEHIPYQDNRFDLTYSWGVIHHSPDMEQCLSEIIRVTRPGGTIKLMIYNKHSLFAFYRYLLAGLFKGRPFAKWDDILFDHQESPGTKAYTSKEIKKMLKKYPVTLQLLKAPATNHDLLFYKLGVFRWLAYCAACLLGWNRIGWFMMIEMQKNEKEYI